MNRKIVIPQNIQIIGHLTVRWNQISATRVDLAKGYHLMTYSPTGVEATAVWPCQDLGTGSRTAGSGSKGKEAGRAIAMETMWLA